MSSLDHSPFRGGTCYDQTFTAYHDPNVHILLTIVFGIFALVFIYYFATRRPKAEYFFLFLFTGLEIGSFVLRLYGELVWATIAMMVYSAAIGMSVCVLYMLYARWCQIADRYYDTKMFDLGMRHPAFPVCFLVLIIALVIAGVWVPTIMWVVYLALFFAIWVTTIVALIRHRRHRPPTRERTIAMSQMEGKFNMTPLVTSHKTLDNMMVMLVVLSTIMLVKTIFLTISFVLVLLFFITPFYYVFCILEDLAFCVILSSPEAVMLFEPSRHMPEARSEMMNKDTVNPLPLSQHQHDQRAAYHNQYSGQPNENHEAITMPAQDQEANAPYLAAQNMQQENNEIRPVAY